MSRCWGIVYVLLFLLLISCNKNVDSNKIKFIKIFNHKSIIKYDTIDYEKLLKHTQEDSLLETIDFWVGKAKHTIRMFSHENKIIDCGGDIQFYELDSLGIIFSRNIPWKTYSYYRIKCTNDSINNIIQYALDRIILHPELNTYYHAIKPPKEEKILK